ncbi:MAG TPA: hypothetical protein VGP36_16190 [Mycobacteriales bacterium]|nr:hypothetical protein [Mycobacteriales bacterium]
MTAVPDERDDDRLLAELGAAVRDEAAVPDGLRRAGRAAYGWRTVDAELAELEAAPAGAVGTRAAGDEPRALRFRAGEVLIEVELTADGLQGQVVPPRAARMTLETASGTAQTTEVDVVGWFLFSPPPREPFRLRLDPPAVVTSWTRP